MFNVKRLAIADTADMPVRDAAGEAQFDEEGNPLSVTLFSPGTKQYQKAKHARDERHNARVMNRMQGKPDAKLSAEDAATERAEFLAACTASFNFFTYEDRRGFEMFKAAYADIAIGHLADDADKWLGERGNFVKPLATSSPSTSDKAPG